MLQRTANLLLFDDNIRLWRVLFRIIKETDCRVKSLSDTNWRNVQTVSKEVISCHVSI